METILSQRGKPIVVNEGFKFRAIRKTSTGVKWRCTLKSCYAMLITDDSESVILGKTGEHTHPPPANIHREAIRNGVKRKATEDIAERPIKLIREEIKGSSDSFSSAVTKNDV